MIEQLTQEQIDTFPFYVKKWVTIANSVVPEGLYTPEIVDRIKDAIQLMYKAANLTIDRDNIIMSTSPTMSPFIFAARRVGVPGTPKKRATYKLDGLQVVEDFVNGFENPLEIVKEASDAASLRRWGALNADFRAFVDFFATETELGTTVLVPFKELNACLEAEITTLTYDLLIGDNLCVFSQKPVYQDFDNSGDYPKAVSGDIRWSDGTCISYGKS